MGAGLRGLDVCPVEHDCRQRYARGKPGLAALAHGTWTAQPGPPSPSASRWVSTVVSQKGHADPLKPSTLSWGPVMQCLRLPIGSVYVVRFVHRPLLARGLLLPYGSLCVQRAASGMCRGGLLKFKDLKLLLCYSKVSSL